LPLVTVAGVVAAEPLEGADDVAVDGLGATVV
jgi:hypothetical protein